MEDGRDLVNEETAKLIENPISMSCIFIDKERNQWLNPEKMSLTKVELETSQAAATSVLELAPHDPSVPYENGYQFPPKHSNWQATAIFFKSFWGFFTTPFGFLVTIYGLNVVVCTSLAGLSDTNQAMADFHRHGAECSS
jgi:hypothetical protein